MVVFTGTYVGSCDVDIARVFRAATTPDLLGRWTIGEFDNVRVMGATAFTAGSRFRADEVLAEDADQMDHLYEVLRYAAPFAFAWRCVDGPHYVAELQLTAQDAGTRISWTHSSAPTVLFDRVMSVLLYSRTKRATQGQAEREIRRLVALAKDLE